MKIEFNSFNAWYILPAISLSIWSSAIVVTIAFLKYEIDFIFPKPNTI